MANEILIAPSVQKGLQELQRNINELAQRINMIGNVILSQSGIEENFKFDKDFSKIIVVKKEENVE